MRLNDEVNDKNDFAASCLGRQTIESSIPLEIT